MPLVKLNTQFGNPALPKVAFPTSLVSIGGLQAAYEMRDKLDQSGNTRDLLTSLAFDSAGLVCTGAAGATSPFVEPAACTFLVAFNATGNDQTRNVVSSMTGAASGTLAGTRLITTAAGALTLQSARTNMATESATAVASGIFGGWRMALAAIDNSGISLQLYGGGSASTVLPTRSAATGQYILGGGAGSFATGMVGKVGLFAVWNRLLTPEEKGLAFSKGAAIMATKGVSL